MIIDNLKKLNYRNLINKSNKHFFKPINLKMNYLLNNVNKKALFKEYKNH